MLELFATDEFAKWFAALSNEHAEEIATALDLVEELGPGRCAPRSTEWMIWYAVPEAPEFEMLEQWAHFRDEAMRALGQLASQEFVTRFAKLDSIEAATVSAAIEKIKAMAGTSRKGLAAARSVPPWAMGERRSAVAQAYRAALLAAGLDENDLPAHTLALRQLTIDLPPKSRHAASRSTELTSQPSERARLLYGVDPRRSRALILVGEHLDRHFYGDSVRCAEQKWKHFLADETTTESLVAKRSP